MLNIQVTLFKTTCSSRAITKPITSPLAIFLYTIPPKVYIYSC